MNANWYVPSYGGNGSMVSNGQIVPVPMFNQYFPQVGLAPIYKGNGQGPPTLPINYMNTYQGQSDTAASVASNNPWSFKGSPLPILIFAVIIGGLALRFIHFR